MTPLELLDDVKTRFSVLLYDDQKALESMLRKALILYQDRAGFVGRVSYPKKQDKYLLPNDFLARVVVKDNHNMFVTSDYNFYDAELELKLNGHESFPITMIYMIDVLKVDFATWQVPSTSYGLIADYLELLITMQNSERLRRVSAAGKLDTSDIPLNSDLSARKNELELAISANRAIMPAVGISY